jgi:hypothetical protein
VCVCACVCVYPEVGEHVLMGGGRTQLLVLRVSVMLILGGSKT